jgi:thiamine biosynthesis lipoprotein
LQRARPHLGTIVSIGIRGMSRAAAMHAFDSGFAAVATVHRLMSFHERGSDVDRLNCHALEGPVEVSPWTMQVLRCALQLAAQSDGAFDIAVARELVASGLLPRPRSRRDAEPDACWRDIELIGNEVRFHRPLWIDLGGIAKGFAVDRALASIPMETNARVCVNAGGDLRVRGPGMQPVWLRVAPSDGLAPVMMIQDGSIASSSGMETNAAAHVHGAHRTPMGKDCFVSVLTDVCMLADALTKIVMAMPADADPILRSYAATAHLYRGQAWRTLGAPA